MECGCELYYVIYNDILGDLNSRPFVLISSQAHAAPFPDFLALKVCQSRSRR